MYLISPPRPMRPEPDLDQASQHADHYQHEHDQIRRIATLHHLDRKRRENGRRRRTGCADQSLGAAQPGRHQTHDDDAHDARQGTVGGIARRNGRVDGYPKGDRRRKCHQHRSQTAPDIAAVSAAAALVGQRRCNENALRCAMRSSRGSSRLRSCRRRALPPSGSWYWASRRCRGLRPPASCRRSSRSPRRRVSTSAPLNQTWAYSQMMPSMVKP